MRLADAPGLRPWQKSIVDRNKLVVVAKIRPKNLMRLARFVGVRLLGCHCREKGDGRPCAFCALYLVDMIHITITQVEAERT